jgi:alkanesulfonate monooxygenase SsuD/methylene tetrahydromethanopterin reductase-like flavin-dependent oxidoreductase (luciferase family)
LPPQLAVADLSPADLQAMEAMKADALVGTAEQAADKMLALAARLALDELVVCTWAHDPAVQLRSFELLSEAFALNPSVRLPALV